MRQSKSRQEAVVAQAVQLAREVAPDLSNVLLTHYQDADALDVLRPGETDLETVAAVNRAVAAEMVEYGVEVWVQQADKAAFRRWMTDRDDIAKNRRAWIDRNRLLFGAEALKLLGLKAPKDASRPTFGKLPGPIADQVLETYGEEDSDDFDGLVQDILQADRADILDLAVRKIREMQGDDAADDLNWVIRVAAEGAEIGPSGWAELVALPVALAVGKLQDGEAFGRGFIASGSLEPDEEIRLLPGWRSPDALADLSYAAIRRVLLDITEGREPRDLPPGDMDDLARNGFGVLLGIRIDWSIPVWDSIVADGGLPEAPDQEAEPTPDQERRAALGDTWRVGVFEDSNGCVPLAIVPLSEVANEISEFLIDAADQTSALAEIREFVAVGRQEAGGEDIVCLPQVNGDDLELSLYTNSGRYLDSLALPGSRLPAPAQEMSELIGGFAQIVQSRPDR